MNKQKKRDFRFLLVLMGIIVFLLNSEHLIQQGIYNNVYVEMAENFWAGLGWTYSEFPDGNPTYPIWGYPFLVLIDNGFGLEGTGMLTIQFFLAMYCIMLFYKMFNLSYRIYHCLLFIPFYAIMSIKTPDAIATGLIFIYVYYASEFHKSNNKKYLLLAALVLAVCVNFRTEYIIFPFFQLIYYIYSKAPVNKLNALSVAGLSLSMSVILLLPWGFYFMSNSGKFSLNASNGGMVSYISLGSVPDNPWGLVVQDSVAFAEVERYNIESPVSIKGDSLLKSKFFDAVADHPGSYLYKCGYNAVRAAGGGIYTGEYANIIYSKQDREGLEALIKGTETLSDKLAVVASEPMDEVIFYIAEKSLRVLSVPFLVALLLSFLFYLFKYAGTKPSYLTLLTISLILFRFTTVSLLMYEYRFMNVIFLLLLGYFLNLLSKVRNKS
jgi:hypothetical protein